jgi:hypothetical protein
MYYLLSLCFAFSYLFVQALYRLFFHPLCRYPGPTLAALTDWYETYYSIVKGGGLLAEYEQLHKLHGKYLEVTKGLSKQTSIGPVIRVGPNAVSENIPVLA